MTIPTYDKCMLPLLQFAADGAEHHIKEAIEVLAAYFGLTDAERAELLPSGKKFKFSDKVQWANTYLKKAGLLQSVNKGTLRITDVGLNVVQSKPPQIDVNFLMQFPEFVNFKLKGTPHSDQKDISISAAEIKQTPQETLQESYQTLREQLAQDLLETILSCSPEFFERLVLDLLLALGYGGAIEDAGKVVGKTGDNGIDCIIKEDKLGFDAIYIQAKKWDKDNVVGSPVVQAFAGSLMGQGAAKGVFITTSSFSKQAITYASKLSQLKIILIDGEQLAKLMIDNNIGVAPVEMYTIKKVDTDYFQVE